jgi:hypothetical protein
MASILTVKIRGIDPSLPWRKALKSQEAGRHFAGSQTLLILVPGICRPAEGWFFKSGSDRYYEQALPFVRHLPAQRLAVKLTIVPLA